MVLLPATAGQARGADSSDLQSAIEASAARLGVTASDDVRVAVRARDGQVVLVGRVRLYQQRLVYEQAAWQTPGVDAVDNEIRVEPVAALSDRAIEREIFTLGKLNRLQGAGLRVEVNSGMVRVAGTFHDPADVIFLRQRVAGIEGVRGIEISASFPV